MGLSPLPDGGAQLSAGDSDEPEQSDSRQNLLPAVTLDDDVFSGQAVNVSISERAYIPAQVGRFPILRRLGAGGMGAVYAAYDELLDRKVALKVMHTSRGGSVGRRQRTLVEARALARLTHANIPMVYEVGEAEGQVYISMEYIDGATLADWLAEAPRSWQDILSMYVQAGAGLAAAHQAGIVHRDFKPDNVLVGRDGRPRVVDFGLARIGGQSSHQVPLPSSLSGRNVQLPPAPEEADSPPTATPGPQRTLTADSSLDRLTVAGSISGTPGYMSPEQYAGGDVDPLSDQFSFCAALYEALFGYLPFAGETLEELAKSVQGPARPPPPGSRVPVEVQRALLRGLSLSPRQRFASMSDLLAALRLELSDSAGSSALGRFRILRLLATLALVLGAAMALRMASGNVQARDGVLGSLILLGVIGGAGLLRFRTLLENMFHRRIYLALLLVITENLGQRLLGWKLGWVMRQLMPFEMVVWAGGMAMMSLLGLRPLRWVAPALAAVAALIVLWPAFPRALMLMVYLSTVVCISVAWAKAGQERADSAPKRRGDKSPRQPEPGFR
jgi:serine/threonine protein kinase